MQTAGWGTISERIKAMQYMGGKSRIAGAIANIINEIPRRKIQNSGPDCLRHIRNGGTMLC